MTVPAIEPTTESDRESPPPAVHLRVGDDGSLLLPPAVCDAFGLEPGDSVQLDPALVGLTITPIVTDEEAEAFWGPDWRESLARAAADVAAGRTQFYASTEEFFAAFNARDEPNADPR